MDLKLKNVLIFAFLTLTLIPIITVSLLLYKSGYELSEESYIRNLTESISVQTDYIVQSIDTNMILDYRFAKQSSGMLLGENIQDNDLYAAFQSYLKASEDKIIACLLLDKSNEPIYTIGEASVLQTITNNLPDLTNLDRQTVMEFELEPGEYSLATLTPVQDSQNAYIGSLISIYDQAYLFKIISSYYKISDTSTYICRANGDVINFRALEDEHQNSAIKQALVDLTFTSSGVIDIRSGSVPILGYYKKIGYTPWYLVGFIDDTLVAAFTNQYVLTYFLIIAGVLLADMLLAFYFSTKVVKPINSLIQIMEGYSGNISESLPNAPHVNEYYETKYLKTKFVELMKRISLVQHNFEGVYQLYQSGNMSDTNIAIDTKAQTISSNKEVFQKLINELEVPPGACIVERFINCFSKKDSILLMEIFENMRDRHLSVPSEIEVYTPHLGKKWFHILVVPVYENDFLSHLFVQLRDITSFKKHEMESLEKALRDSLTGLYNRLGFIQYVTEVLQTPNESALHGLLFIDMDYFKMVNDNMGHAAGDELLRSVGTILQSAIPPDGLVSRFGGDEFAVFIPNTTTESIAKIKETLHEQLVYPFETPSISFVVTASIGDTICKNTSDCSLEELLHQADSSMYVAKKRVKQTDPK